MPRWTMTKGERDETRSKVTAKQDLNELRRLQKMAKRSRTNASVYADRCEQGIRYYFDDQWRKEDADILTDRGQVPIVINRIKPTVKLVHGLMVSQPMDWVTKPVGRNDDSMADSATAGLKFISRENNIEQLTNFAAWWSLTYGVGWAMAGLHVRNKDPRTESVQARWLDSREVTIDPMCRELDLTDCRWVNWRRKVDLQDAIDEFGKYANELKGQVGAHDSATDSDFTKGGQIAWGENDAPAHGHWSNPLDWDDEAKHDYDKDTKQVILNELWERVPTEVWLIDRKDTTTSEFDPTTEEGAAMLQGPDVVRYYRAKVPKMRYSIFCGPYILKQDDSPYDHDRFPFIPCWHERDEKGHPVSYVESLKQPQDEINHRRSRALFEMSNPQMHISPGALARSNMDMAQAQERFLKGGCMWVAEQGEIGYIIRPELAAGQIQLMQDSKAEIQATSGANDDLMGYDSSSKSGVAKQTQIDQGQTMQRPAEHNLKLFRKLLGEQLLSLMCQAHTDEWTVRITDEAGKDRLVTINHQTQDPETGAATVLNDINQVDFELTIEDMPWTPTLRQRSSEFLMQMANAEADPVIRSKLQRMAIQVSDMPEKGKILDIYADAEQSMMGQMQGQQEQQAPPPDPISANFKDLPPIAQHAWLVKEGLIDPNAPMTDADMVPTQQKAQQAHDASKTMATQDHQSQQASMGHDQRIAQMDRQHMQSLESGDMQHMQAQDMATMGHGNQLEMQDRQAQMLPQEGA